MLTKQEIFEEGTMSDLARIKMHYNRLEALNFEKRLKESKQQGIDEIIIRMLEMNMPKHQIVDISGMTMEYIEKLNIKKDGEQ